MKKIGAAVLITLILSITTIAETIADKNRKQVGKNTYALVVGGINKDPKDRLAKFKVVSDLQRLLLDNPEISPKTLTVLIGDNLSTSSVFGTSTAKNIQKKIEIVKTVIKPEDRFIFYYVGQANIISEKLRFNLPGTDITHEQLARWIKGIRASSILIVLDCPGSGLAAKAMSGPGRVVICSCTAEQRYSTRFSEHFVPAFTDSETDMNSDGRISVLEAFTAASRQIDDWYRQKKLLTTEIPVLEDDGDGQPCKQPWRYKLDGTDGLAASEFFLIRQK